MYIYIHIHILYVSACLSAYLVSSAWGSESELHCAAHEFALYLRLTFIHLALASEALELQGCIAVASTRPNICGRNLQLIWDAL